MNASIKEQLAKLLESPILAPLQPVLARLETRDFPTLHDLNKLLDLVKPALNVQAGHPLRFVPQAKGRMGFESQYEPRCFLTGEVQTRPDNWHDLFNALVWLTFPKAKAAINAQHYQALSAKHDSSTSQRGKVRDTATLLDESGVFVASANPELTKLLLTFQWKELFWHRREQVRNEMGFYVFGHGLYEKALKPYTGMTGQGLITPVKADFFERCLQEQLSEIDQTLAQYLDSKENCLVPSELHPIPLLGVPGLCLDNERASYYDNTTYFRPGRNLANQM